MVGNMNDRQRSFLDAAIALTERHGMFPSRKQMYDELGFIHGNGVRLALAALVKSGHLTQPVKGGPWIPVQDADGMPLAWTFREGGAFHYTPTTTKGTI